MLRGAVEPDATPPPTAADLRAAFDAATPLTVGVEEEAMLLDPVTLDLCPRAFEVLSVAPADLRFKAELPAAQLELVTDPAPDVTTTVAALAAGRRDLAALADGIGRLGAAAVHPFAAVEGELSRGPRYAFSRAEYGAVGRLQLVGALQVHVAVGGAERSLAVYNALRSHLPELAALAANGAWFAGRDSGLASVRPKLAELLPRQGVPPVLASWEALADAYAWGVRAGAMPSERLWWWELRPHPSHGTLELRVPDAQAAVADAAAVVAVAQALVAWLAERWDAGEPLPVAETWRIEANRWSAARRGLDGTLADLVSGEPVPTRDRLRAVLAALAPTAERLGSGPWLREAARLVEANGAVRQRMAAAGGGGARAVAAWLADAYLEGC